MKHLDKIVQKGIDLAPTALLVFVTLFVGLFLIGWIMKQLDKLMVKRNVDQSLRPFTLSMVAILLKIILFISIAQMVGVQMTSFVAILGAMAFAVGMALQGSLGNFAGGVLILLFKPFKVGDLISAQGFTGVVESIQVLATTLITPDNRTIILPNGALSNAPVENISTKGVIRVDMTFGIGYGDDIDKARNAIQKVINACPTAMKDKEHDILVTELADSSVNFAVRVWSASSDYWDTYFFMHENIKKEFDAQSVGIPYPTMDVNVIK